MLYLYTNIHPPKGECSEDRIAQIGTGVSLRQCLKMKFETYRCIKEIPDVSKELEIDHSFGVVYSVYYKVKLRQLLVIGIRHLKVSLNTKLFMF